MCDFGEIDVVFDLFFVGRFKVEFFNLVVFENGYLCFFWVVCVDEYVCCYYDIFKCVVV